MNIDKTDGLTGRSGPTSISAESSSKRSAEAAGRGASESVPGSVSAPLTLSPGLQAILDSSRSEPGSLVDEQRVQTIRQAISDGTYHVNPERLAAHFLELETLIE